MSSFSSITRQTWDEWTVLAVIAFQIAHQVWLTMAYKQGLGRKAEAVSVLGLMEVTRLIWIGGSFFTPVSVVPRIPIAIFLIYISGI
ncbi:hypothetical protein PG994_015398 [Apiospora phragmitis]|uniref:Uncharacterized protein n=1 Tax=Apiospora phragmitis TaxID=2905665 RepID=A0ABR1SQQ2_9PEZI